MAILNDNQSKELCKKIEQLILKNGYFILDTDDWDGLHIDYKPFTHGSNYEYADYTEIAITFDRYNVTDKLQVKYKFIKSIYAGRTGDSYQVYYKRKDGEKDGGRPYSMNEAAEFIANRFIELVENKIMNNKLEARIAKLESLLNSRKLVNEATYLEETNDKILEIQDTLISCGSDIDYIGMEDSKYVIDDLGEDCNKHLQNASDFIDKAIDELTKASDSIDALPYM